MPDLNRNSEPDKNEKRNSEMRLPPRAFLVWIGIIAIVAVVALARNGAETPVEELGSFPDLLVKLTNNLIVPNSGRIIYGLQSSPDIKRITGKYYATQENGKPVLDKETSKRTEVPFKLEIPLTEKKTDLLLDS